MFAITSTACIILTVVLGTVHGASPFVRTSIGDIQGVQTGTGQGVQTGTGGNDINSFLGIPYAQAPVGDLRFKKPVPHSGFKTRFLASKQGPPCNQIDYRSNPVEYIGEEDCLTLNVYVNATRRDVPRPVMVWIYGGGFVNGGTAMYNPTPLVTVGDVIVVTLQYRIGPFGFLSTMDDSSKGNYGLWDQLLALKWVKNNIGAFGGDPNTITIIGESAGSASIAFQTLSTESNGLFRRAILQSGSATSPWAIKKDALTNAQALAAAVGCGPSSSQENAAMVNCLKGVGAENLTRTSVTMPPMGPVVDGEFILKDPTILLASPQLLKRSPFPNFDIMVGVNNNEGARPFRNRAEMNAFRDSSNYKMKLVPRALSEVFNDYNSDMVEAAIFEYMFPDHLDTAVLDLQRVTNIFTDVAQLIPAVQFARAHSSVNGTGKTYFYYFNHFPKWTMDKMESWLPGMHHAYDLHYTFGFNQEIVNAMRGASNFTSELQLSLTFRNMLTQFAISGDPNSAMNSHLTRKWKEFDPKDETYLDFSDHATVQQHVAQRRVSLWLDLLPRLHNTIKH